MDETTAEYGGAEVIGWGVGPVLEKLPDIAKIAVLRGGGLGDLMFALPAVAALRAAYPQASLTLLGTPAHRELLNSTDGPVQDVRVLPFAEGVRPGPEDAADVERFLTAMVSEKFDLAIQLHGGGRFSTRSCSGWGPVTRQGCGPRTLRSWTAPSPTSTTSTSRCVPLKWQGWSALPPWRWRRGLGRCRSLPRRLRRSPAQGRSRLWPFIRAHRTPDGGGRRSCSGRLRLPAWRTDAG